MGACRALSFFALSTKTCWIVLASLRAACADGDRSCFVHWRRYPTVAFQRDGNDEPTTTSVVAAKCSESSNSSRLACRSKSADEGGQTRRSGDGRISGSADTGGGVDGNGMVWARGWVKK